MEHEPPPLKVWFYTLALLTLIGAGLLVAVAAGVDLGRILF
jgi:hypothetical protein